jgi:alkaline phosphatase
MILAVLFSTSAGAKAKNVIIMIADGWDFNQTAALQYYTGKKPVYLDFKVKFPVSTFSASGIRNPYPNAKPGYDPAVAWVSDGNGGLKPNAAYFLGPATDSAAAATALATGTKTTDGFVNMSTDKKPLVTIGRLAKLAGKSAGAISSVEWSHATPAVFGDAHNASRGGYAEIAREMINSDIDVIMGAGSPMFDDNGAPATKTYEFVGGQDTWKKLVDGGFSNVRMIQTVNEFKKLASAKHPKGKYIGTVQAASTLQQARSAGDPQNVHLETQNKNVPTLALMSKAAINVLSQNPKGFFLMIEGGAVDWGNHANQKGRVIEEMIGFNDAVKTVTEWIKANGGWDDNLLIVTGDHDSGFLLGPNGETNIVDMGKGKIPGMKFFSTGHTNMILPLFAQGTGSELFQHYLSTETDPVRGKWIDNTSVFRVMKQQITE